jgi:hypothetical protein
MILESVTQYWLHRWKHCEPAGNASLEIQIQTRVDGQNVRGGSNKPYLQILDIFTCISE